VDLKLLRAQLQQVRPDAAQLPVDHRLVEGDAAAEILRLAAETHCDLIVMGTHGRTWLSRMLMGSVAEQVVRKAPCPVLTVKTQQHVQPSTPETAPATAGRVVAAAK
jgi:nucleotide-binding universal stress UspA family protein